MEPQRFCQAFPRENDTLLVIIRNEDIASHLHQVGVPGTPGLACHPAGTRLLAAASERDERALLPRSLWPPTAAAASISEGRPPRGRPGGLGSGDAGCCVRDDGRRGPAPAHGALSRLL